MRVRVAAILAVVVAVGLVEAGAEEWSKTFAPPGRPEVRVEAGMADVRVLAWERAEVAVRVVTEGWRIRPDEVRISDQASGSRVELRVRAPAEAPVFGHSVRVEISLPREATLQVGATDGNILVRGVRGRVRLASRNGRIEVAEMDGALTAETTDGDLRVSGRFDALDLYSADGNIRADAQPGSKIVGGWELKTGDADLTLRIPADLPASLVAQCGPGGSVRVDLPISAESRQSSAEGQSYRAQLNGGGATLTLTVGEGALRLQPLPPTTPQP